MHAWYILDSRALFHFYALEELYILILLLPFYVKILNDYLCQY